MTTRCCHLLGILLLSITLLRLGGDALQQDQCTSSCDSGNHCSPIWNCTSGSCKIECNGSGCKEMCGEAVKDCKMNLTCCGGGCEQICKAEKNCDLKCSGKNCKKQECPNEVDNCAMHMGCNGEDCEQICKAKKKCDLKCSGENCKKQECLNEVDNCAMHMGCNGGGCEQICNAKKNCDLECFGCTQSCDAPTCRMTRTWPNSSQEKLICSGKGNCCGSFITTYDTPSLRTITFSTKCGESESCTCTKYSKNFYSTSILNTSNVVTSTKAENIQVFATKISAGHGTETYTLQETLMQSPSSLISPSPLPSSVISLPPTLTALLSYSLWSSKWAASETEKASPTASTIALQQTLMQSPSSLKSPSPLPSSSSPYSSSAAIIPAETASSFAPSLSSSLSSKPAAVSLEAASSLSPPAASKSAVSASLILSPSSSLSSASSSVAALFSTSPSMWTSSSSTLEEAIKVFEDFITTIQTIPKRKEEIEITRKSIFNAAVALEKFALSYGKYHLTEGNSTVKINSHKLVLVIQKAYRQNASDFYLGKQELQASMKLSSANFVNNVSVVVGILYKDIHEVLFIDQPFTVRTGNTRYLDSGIIAVSMDPKPEKLQENVTLNFRNLKVHKGERKCMFWSGLNGSSGGFSERGCYVVAFENNSEETVCSCDHLTHFAVLVDYSGSPGVSSKLTEEDETILEIITYVGLCLSILAILLTIILYSFFTDIWQPLSQIRLSLSVALGAGQITFLAGINATENKASCIAAAAFLQYFLMAAFCWMLVEGIYFYLFLVKVYNINTKMHMYHVISWGLPIIMVVISLSVASGKDGIQSFTSEKYCWLSSTNNLIWIFVTFMAFIEILNILILVRVMKEMSALIQPKGEDNHMQQIRLGIKTCMVMIPLLGVTWVFGLLLPLHKAFAYIFTIFNSTQGILIFVLHCVRNSQIRERLKRKMSIICPSAADHGNSMKKSSQVNPSAVGYAWAVEMESFKE